MGPDDLSVRMTTTLAHIFEYNKVRHDGRVFIEARLGPDEPITAVFGDWGGDGNGYWETCAHCYAPLMGRKP
jgi:hypothetical protein